MMFQWQDIVFFLGQLGFAIAILPALFSDEKPPLSTTVMTFLILACFIPANASLGLYLAAGMDVFTTVAWGILTFQKLFGFQILYPRLFPDTEVRRERPPGYWRIGRLLIWRMF